MPRTPVLLLLTCLCLALGGCGQKGPLVPPSQAAVAGS